MPAPARPLPPTTSARTPGSSAAMSRRRCRSRRTAVSRGCGPLLFLGWGWRDRGSGIPVSAQQADGAPDLAVGALLLQLRIRPLEEGEDLDAAAQDAGVEDRI